MKSSWMIGCFFLFGLVWGARGYALDCLDLRIFPLFQKGQIALEGMVVKGKPTKGVGRRNRIVSFFTGEAASLSIEIRINQASMSVRLDEKGTFNATYPELLASGIVELYDPAVQKVFARRDFAFPASAPFLMVSDIDDTVMISDVTHKVRLVLKTIFRSVKGRKPVPGTPGLYADLMEKHGYGTGQPLLLFLSSSPSTLARFLEAFLKEHAFPGGILCLKRSLTAEGFKSNDHKHSWLKKLAEMYPGLPMLLLGDSGESDPEIYTEFLEKKIASAPGVIIHQVDESEPPERLQEIRLRLKRLGVPFFIWTDAAKLRQELRENRLLKE